MYTFPLISPSALLVTYVACYNILSVLILWSLYRQIDDFADEDHGFSPLGAKLRRCAKDYPKSARLTNPLKRIFIYPTIYWLTGTSSLAIRSSLVAAGVANLVSLVLLLGSFLVDQNREGTGMSFTLVLPHSLGGKHELVMPGMDVLRPTASRLAFGLNYLVYLSADTAVELNLPWDHAFLESSFLSALFLRGDVVTEGGEGDNALGGWALLMD